jgi:hypothetical protein
MDPVRECRLAHKNLKAGGILLALGLVTMITFFVIASVFHRTLILLGACAGWLLSVLGAMWIVDGLRHRYTARHSSTTGV